MMDPVKCPECGAPVSPPAQICPRCGHPLAVPSLTEAETQEIRASALTAKIVAVLLIVYMLGVVGYFFYDHLL